MMEKNFKEEDFLKDNFCLTGVDIESLKDFVKFLNENMKTELINPKDFDLIDVESYDDSTMMVSKLRGHDPVLYNMECGNNRCEYIPLYNNVPYSISDYYKEVFNNQTFFLNRRIDKKLCYVSKIAINKMLTTLKLAFPETNKRSTNHIRNIAIAQMFHDINTVSVTTCELNGIKKMFSMNTAKYIKIDNQIIFDIIADYENSILGKSELLKWYYDHTKTRVMVLFPEKSKEWATENGINSDIILGLEFINSQIGDSEFYIRSFLYNNKKHTYSYHKEFSRKHVIGVNNKIEDIENMIKIESKKVFGDFTFIPEILTKFTILELENENISNFWNFIKERKTLKVSKILCERKLQKLDTEIPMYFNGINKITVLEFFMALEELLEKYKKESTEEKITKLIGDLYYENYDKFFN